MGHRKGLSEQIENGLGGGFRRRPSPPGTVKDGKLVATKPSHQLIAETLFETPPDICQEFIPHGMPHGVVDGFELVEIEQEEHNQFVRPDILEGRLDFLAQTKTVAEAGQRVMMCQIAEPLIGDHGLGNVRRYTPIAKIDPIGIVERAPGRRQQRFSPFS